MRDLLEFLTRLWLDGGGAHTNDDGGGGKGANLGGPEHKPTPTNNTHLHALTARITKTTLL